MRRLDYGAVASATYQLRAAVCLVFFAICQQSPDQEATCSAELGCRREEHALESCGANGGWSCGLSLPHTSWLAPGEWISSLPGKSSAPGKFVAVLYGSQFRVHEASNSETLWAVPPGPEITPLAEPAAPTNLTAVRIVKGRLQVLNAEGVVWSSPGWYVTAPKRLFVRFTVLKVRGESDYMQLGGFRLFTTSSQLDLRDAKVSSSYDSTHGHDARNVIDGNMMTKWKAFIGKSGHSNPDLIIEIPRFERLLSFQLVTANDMPEYDPMQWRIEVSCDGASWTTIHGQVVDYPTPFQRGRSMERSDFSMWDDLQAFNAGEHANMDEPTHLALTNKGRLILKHTASDRIVWSAPSPVMTAAPFGSEVELANTPDYSQKCGSFLSCRDCVAVACTWCSESVLCTNDTKKQCPGESADTLVVPGVPLCPNLLLYQEGVRHQRLRLSHVVDLENRIANYLDYVAKPMLEAPTTTDTEMETEDVEIDSELVAELMRRADAAGNRSGKWPYQVLNVTHDAPTGAIRKSYKRLILLFHPDKWATQQEAQQKAATKAFADIRDAFETIGSPDKRTTFDEFVSVVGDNFKGFWDTRTQTWNAKFAGDEDFYFGDQLITTLTQDLWDRRVIGETIWIIEFYTAWCKGCRVNLPHWPAVAKKISHLPVEIGAVNCVRSSKICKELKIEEWPSVRILSRKFGLVETVPIWDKEKEVWLWDDVPTIADQISYEWIQWMKFGRVHWEMKPASFVSGGELFDSKSMWVVAFVAEPESPRSKATIAELLRISYKLRGLPVEVGFIDCSLPFMRDVCTKDFGVPLPSHRPFVKMWPSGDKREIANLTSVGEVLYPPAEWSVAQAFRLVERVLFAAVADRPVHIVDDASRALALRKGPVRGLHPLDATQLVDTEVLQFEAINSAFDEYAAMRKKRNRIKFGKEQALVPVVKRVPKKPLVVAEKVPDRPITAELEDFVRQRSKVIASRRPSDVKPSPYDVLRIPVDAQASTIRLAFQDLVRDLRKDLWELHPLMDAAADVRIEIENAYAVIGTPDRRAHFDRFGGEGWFEHLQERKRVDLDLYYGNPLIATLTDEIWDQKVVGTSIWVIEFHTPWCSFCRQHRIWYSEVLKMVQHLPAEFGSVDCSRNLKICKELYSITEFPSLRIVNHKFGFMEAVQLWDSREKQWIFDEVPAAFEEKIVPWNMWLQNSKKNSNLTEEAFRPSGILSNSSAMWIIAFLENPESSHGKAISRGLLRLSASLSTFNIEVGSVDCSVLEMSEVCQKDQEVYFGMPVQKRRSLIKVWPAGPKNVTDDFVQGGQVLPIPDEVGLDEVFALITRSIRFALHG